MPTLVESRDALIESPGDFGLSFVWPMPRMKAPQVPVLVESASIRGGEVELVYSRANLRAGDELVPSDVLWHQRSNTLALVSARMDRDRVLCLGLVAPETEEERGGFVSTGGAGHWVCVFQAWKKGWALPTEILNRFPRLVDTGERDVWDLFPGTTARGAMGGFAAQGLIDPDRLLTHRTSSFLARQRKAMLALAGGLPEGEDEAALPGLEELGKGEVRDTVIPVDPPAPEGKIISYGGQGRRSKAQEG